MSVLEAFGLLSQSGGGASSRVHYDVQLASGEGYPKLKAAKAGGGRSKKKNGSRTDAHAPKKKPSPEPMSPSERANSELSNLAMSRAKCYYLSRGMADCDADVESWDPENHKRFIATWEIGIVFAKHGIVRKSQLNQASSALVESRQGNNDKNIVRNYELRETSDGKGVGAFAMSDFVAGQLVLTDESIVYGGFDELGYFDVKDSLSELGDAEKAAFWELHDWQAAADGTAKTDKGIFATNAIFVSPEEEDTREVFPIVSRINHSCLPNIVVEREGLFAVNVFVLRPIAVGEEFLMSYVDPQKPSEHRQAFLKDHFGFSCRCMLCHEASEPRLTASTCSRVY